MAELFKLFGLAGNDWNDEAEDRRVVNNLQIVSIACIPIAEILSVLDLVVTELTGTINDRHLLVRSVARQERARALLLATGTGALELIPGVTLRCGGSVLAVRPLKEVMQIRHA